MLLLLSLSVLLLVASVVATVLVLLLLLLLLYDYNIVDRAFQTPFFTKTLYIRYFSFQTLSYPSRQTSSFLFCFLG